MSDVLLATDKWQQKLRLEMRLILKHIDERRKQPTYRKYRGQEHFWYSVWNCVLAKLCDYTTTLVPCPQRWITSVVRNQDQITEERCLVPDFTLIRVSEARRKARSSAQPTRRSARKPKGPGVSQAQDQVHDQPEPGPNHTGALVHQKYVAFAEIKPPPESDTFDGIEAGLLEARIDLIQQVRLFFSKPSERRKKKREVVGIYASGQFWGWKVYNPDNLGIKPLSVNKDATYAPPEEEEEHEQQEILISYELGTPESDIAMQEMLEAIFNLHGSLRMFGNAR